MKKMMLAVAALCMLGTLWGCSKKNTDEKKTIGIAKTVQHAALDDVERGIMDVINESGIAVNYDLQNANGDMDTATQIANKYKDEHVDLAVGIATPVALALANAIKDIPVVFGTVTDPVGAGLVTSLTHGEGNITGMSDAVPTVQHIAQFAKVANIKKLGYIYTSNEANSISSLTLVREGCEKAGITLVTQAIANASEVKAAADAIVKHVDGIYLTMDNAVFSDLASLVQVFEAAKKPIFSADVTGAQAGGILMASGFNYYKAGRATGELCVEILNGKSPADIPVRLMTKASDSDLLLNLDAAALCGITFDNALILQANMIFADGKLTVKEEK